ncbi:MAG: hypothetical protein ACOX3H_06825 [Saccharofermentanales bacterium]|jgi:hypothetical protein
MKVYRVIKSFYDKDNESQVFYPGDIVTFTDAKRAKANVTKGHVEEIEVITIGKVTTTTKK